MTPDILDELVQRFLTWRLPQSVSADACATDRNYRFPRSGTNLLTAAEARAMLEHVLDIPAIREAEARGLERALQAVSLLSPYTLELERAHAAIRRLIDEAR